MRALGTMGRKDLTSMRLLPAWSEWPPLDNRLDPIMRHHIMSDLDTYARGRRRRRFDPPCLPVLGTGLSI